MRNLKKVLSLVLCVAMLLSVMVMGTGAASFTDQDEFSDNYAEAAEVLTGMGIIQVTMTAVSCLSVTSTAHRWPR